MWVIGGKPSLDPVGKIYIPTSNRIAEYTLLRKGGGNELFNCS
jgi:hypothetical protein